jgi:CYTH domain-containing protein
MSVVRRYLVAPSLARLVRKERGSARVVEGFFPPQAGRTSFVRVEGSQCHLVLMTTDAGGVSSEERTEVPRAHGDALLDVCGGKVAYERSALSLGARDALVDRYTAPGALELVSVAFESADEAKGFAAPAWFGPEVTADAAYESRAIALEGLPATAETALSNAALDAVLDLLEHRFAYRYQPQSQAQAPQTQAAQTQTAQTQAAPAPAVQAPAAPPAVGRSAADDAGVMSALRRLAGNVGAPAAAEPKPEASRPEPQRPAPAPEPADAASADARIDDVMEGLSQALGAAVQPDAKPEDDKPFERWSVRPRRAQT